MREVAGLIALPDGSLTAGRVAFTSRIERVEPFAAGGPDYVLPGLIDLQVNGTHGMDVMAASPDDLTDMSRYLAREGVTAYLPTAITASLDRIAKVERAVARLPRSQSRLVRCRVDPRPASGRSVHLPATPRASIPR